MALSGDVPPLLTTLYKLVAPLEDFVPKDNQPSLQEQIKEFIQSVYICMVEETSLPQTYICRDPYDVLTEQIIRSHRKWKLRDFTRREVSSGDLINPTKINLEHGNLPKPYPEEEFLAKTEMKILHRILGDDLFYILALRASWFFLHRPNLYLQVMGVPLYQVLRNKSAPPYQLRPSFQHQIPAPLQWIVKTWLSPAQVYYTKKAGFFPECLLDKLSPNVYGAEKLIKHMFLTEDVTQTINPYYKEQLIQILLKLIGNHRELNYRGLANSIIGVRPDSESLEDLLQFYAPHSKVCRFLRRVVHKLLPEDLLGSENLPHLIKALPLIVSSHKEDRLYPFQFMAGMKVRDTPVVCNFEHPRLHLSVIIRWIVLHLLHTLRAYFHVTEAADSRRPHYFRISTWNKIQALGISDLLKKGVLERIEPGTDLGHPVNKPMGICFLRFLPAQISLEPVVKFTKKLFGHPNLKFNLRLAQHITEFLLRATPHIAPHVVHSHAQAYATICNARKNWMSGRKTKDIFYFHINFAPSKVFLSHQQLSSALSNLFPADMRTVTYFPIHKFMITRRTKMSKRTLKTKWRAGSQDFSAAETIRHAEKTELPTVAVSLGDTDFLASEKVFDLLLHYITQVIVECNKERYSLKQGLIHDGPLPTSLLEVFLSSVLSICLPPLQPEDLLLLRGSQLLFASPNQQQTRRALSLLRHGGGHYNLDISWETVTCNFRVPGATYVSGNGPLHWSGLTIHPASFQTELDYRQLPHIPAPLLCIRGVKAVLLKHLPRLALRKAIPEILDMKINTSTTVVKNLFLRFLLAANWTCSLQMRFSKARIIQEPQLLMTLIKNLSTRLLNKVERLKKSSGLTFWLTKNNIDWICATAFHLRLARLPRLFSLSIRKHLQKEVGKYKNIQPGWRRLTSDHCRMLDLDF